jgi:lipoprotein signal peptidase
MSLVTGLAVLDQVLKHWVTNTLSFHQRIPSSESFFAITRVKNMGAFLGSFQGLPSLYQTLLSVGIPSAVLVAISLFWIRAKMKSSEEFAFLLLIAGGMGNLWLTLQGEGVVETFFLKLHQHAVIFFNIADVMIFTGIVVLMFQSILTGVKSDRFKSAV